MKHLKLFETTNEYNNWINSDNYITPYIIKDKSNNNVRYQKYIKPLLYDSEIEYLQSNENQYIDLNIVPDANTGLYIKAKRDSNYNDRYVIGLRDNTNSTRWCIACSDRSGWYYGYGGYEPLYNGAGINFINEITLNYLNNGLATSADENGNLTSSKTLPTLNFYPANKIRLFGSSGVVATYSKFVGNIYAVKISQGDQIIYDLIPVRKNGIGYMYDKINNILLANEGTGDFVLGPDI